MGIGRRTLLAVGLACALAHPVWSVECIAADIGTPGAAAAKPIGGSKGYSLYAGGNYPTRVFWGDPNVHTGWSLDAGALGCTLGPEDAIRFARGEEVRSSTGQPAKLSRPIDWIVVADDADGLGLIQEIRDGNPALTTDATVAEWSRQLRGGPQDRAKAAREIGRLQSTKQLPAVLTDPSLARAVWERNTALMDRLNAPGRFTAFIGYEWTSDAKGDELHRNVVFRDGKQRADQVLPLTTADSGDPASLWQWMDAWEKKTGGRVLAIPHGGNLSNGRMFALADFVGNPMTGEYAAMRARWEPLYEVTQIKGDSETHPTLSPADELAGYEKWDAGNGELVPKRPEMLQREYVRRALEYGLLAEVRFGVNPFKFGLVGGTDTHTGLATADEDAFFGLHPGVEPEPGRWERAVLESADRKMTGAQMAAGAWTGAWATENTREALWDAMARREVYATTGPRMTVRLFGGWGFDADDTRSQQLAAAGYAEGVPMGSDLRPAPEGASAPTFLIGAQRDPEGAALDRVQIVKGWLDDDANVQEKVYDVVWSGERQPGTDGKLPPVGDTAGAPELAAVWTDPAFAPTQRAFYYARVLQVPTPRWTAHDAKRFGVTMPPEVPATIQERAYTSPIWYTPPATP
jgi:hypothetical protein